MHGKTLYQWMRLQPALV